jgi:Protein of unknown function (DUF4013)
VYKRDRIEAMLNKLKDALVYPIGDPNWIKKVGMWLLYYVLYLTAPALFGHYLSILKKTMDSPEEEEIPGFDSLWELWKKGFLSLLAIGAVQIVPGGLNMLACGAWMSTFDPKGLDGFPVPFLIFVGIHCAIILATVVFFPAACLQLTTAPGGWRSLFRFKEIWNIATAKPGEYLLLAFFPFLAWCAIVLCALTGIGLLLCIPGLPLMIFSHARLTGFYYRDNIMADSASRTNLKVHEREWRT